MELNKLSYDEAMKMIGHWMSDQGISSLFCDGNTIIAPSINENDDYIEDVVLL